MVEVTLKAEITHPIPKAKLVEAFLKAKDFFPHTLLPAIKNADIQETISVEGSPDALINNTKIGAHDVEKKKSGDCVRFIFKLFVYTLFTFGFLSNDPGGRQRRTVGHTVKAPDQEPFLYNHSTVDRDEKGRISKEISHEVKIVALPLEGGSVCKYAGRYFTVGQGDITEEEMIGAMREKASVMFKAILDYPEAKSMKPSLDYPTAKLPY